MRNPVFFLIAAAVGAAVFLVARLIGNDYLFFAGYTVLQFIVLATAWNILGGYCGYVNFGSAAFFAVGAYSTVALHKLGTNVDRYAAESIAPLLHAIMPFSIPTLTVIAGVVAALIGFGMGYLTLRLRGAFFAIATLALAVVLQTLIVNWDYVGGSRGAYIIRPQEVPIIGSYIQYLFLLMIALAVIALTVARVIERSRLGYGFATIRDDELAAEACGVPTLKLKLIATTISGGLMGMAGASFPYYIGYLEPSSAFGLAYAVNSIAMPMIGGTTMWAGPLIGALLLGIIQQVATVTISSAVNLLIVGLLLIGFVIMAPNGIVGMVRDFLRVAAPARLDLRAIKLLTIGGYVFLVGLGGVVFGLSAAMAGKNSILTGLGVFTLVLSLVYLAAAYGLLKLESWSPLLTIAVLAISIPLSLIFIWLDPSQFNVVALTIAIVDRRCGDLAVAGPRHQAALSAHDQAASRLMSALLEVRGLGKRFGGFVALEGIDLSVAQGERLGLIGPNGSGKSTLVNCMCGTLQNETGTVQFDGHAMNGLPANTRTHRGMARSFQLPRPFVTMTVAENLRIPLLYTVNARPGQHLSPSEIEARCADLAGLVGLSAKADKLPRDLTQVEMRKLELARAMAADPKLLIADESMAGLSQSEVNDIVALLIKMNERGVTIIMIEHIMRAVMAFSQRLVVLVSGKKIADGKPDDVVNNPEVIGAYLGQ